MNKFGAAMLMGLAGLTAAGAPTEGVKPRLVVGIVVDQLRTDYMEQLQDLFGTKGFRMLMQEGVYLRDIDYQAAGLDASSGTASAVTGSWPAYTGVPSSLVYDSDIRNLRPALAKPNASGSVSNDSFTPEGLVLSTIADELAIATDGKAQIYSVAADPQQAVILAGHAGTGAVWINNTSGLWATSSYYGPLPGAAQRMNVRNSMQHRIDTMQWRPLSATVKAMTDKGARTPLFNYKFAKNDRDAYRKAALTPGGNAAVTDMAIELITQMPVGATHPGMISVGYTVAPYKYAAGNAEAETTDAYLRLDAQLGRLLEAVDRYCGRENALIWLTSTGYYDAAAIEDKKYRLPGGEFSIRKARSLLNSYLAARHGIGDYVAAIRNGNVYLDSKLIESKNLSTEALADEARQFLARMSGVEQTYTRSEILSPATPEMEMLNHSYDPKTGADIIIRLAPGWVLADEETASQARAHRQVPVMTPAIIMAPGLKAEKIELPTEGIRLAPTITGILRIRSPNGIRARGLGY